MSIANVEAFRSIIGNFRDLIVGEIETSTRQADGQTEIKRINRLKGRLHEDIDTRQESDRQTELPLCRNVP